MAILNSVEPHFTTGSCAKNTTNVEFASDESGFALEEDAESLEELQHRLETVMMVKAEVESALEERSRYVATLEAASAARIRELIGKRLCGVCTARYDTELAERECEVTALKTQRRRKKEVEKWKYCPREEHHSGRERVS